ncbi:MAG: flagellar biosynthesis protein FlhF [Burkholderiaceae bacterium]|nr:MAG: flagellar biosynthesis protein FlhF [Burkholderiaceae bacterium]
MPGLEPSGWPQQEPQGIERLVERHVERHVEPRVMPPAPMQPPAPWQAQPPMPPAAPMGHAPHAGMTHPMAGMQPAPSGHAPQAMAPAVSAPVHAAPQVVPHVWPQAGHMQPAPMPAPHPGHAVAASRQSDISLQDRYTDEAARVAQVRVDREQQAMLHELRAMKGMIEERFGTLAYMERMQRHPELARLVQRLMDCGFSPALVRRLTDQAPTHLSDLQGWAIQVLEANLRAAESEQPLEDQGGIVAMIGSTGVGKTTSTAKLAAAFAAKHGAANLGLITLDAYRVGAHEQLRSYGRILGVAVHTAHDRQALEDMLDLLSNKRMVLIDTAGIAQRDSRTQELLETLGHRSIEKLLVVNASAQGETIEDVLISYRASQCKGVVLSKIDEAVKLAPALDAVIRHRLKVMAVANGQRVPEDWHRLSAQALIHRALRGGGSAAYRFDSQDVNLLLATPPQQGMVMGGLHA